jgi:hypothetical protein
MGKKHEDWTFSSRSVAFVTECPQWAMARWLEQSFRNVLEQLDRVPHQLQQQVQQQVPQIDCGYRNGSDRMVILRCIGPEQFFLERVVFPFEVLTFNCPQESEVEIWTHGLGGPELLEAIASLELVMDSVPALQAPVAAIPTSPWLQVS